MFYYFLKDPKYPLAAESKSDNCVRCICACPRILWVAPVVICGWNTMPQQRGNRLCEQRPYNRYITTFWRMPSTILQQNLKVVIVLGVTMLVLGFCGWLLWSYLAEILCLDTNKTGFVDVDPPLDILVFFETPQINTKSRVSKWWLCNYACLRFLWVAPVVIFGWNTMPGHK